MKRAILMLVVFMGISVFCVAQNTVDVLYLKDGSVIKGVVVEETQEQVKIRLYDGSIFAYNVDLVQKIVTEDRPYRREIRTTAKKKRGLRGYNGFIESGFTVGSENSFDIISTAHGYQFNNHIFLGGGIAIHDYVGVGEYDDNYFAIPVFVNFRANFLDKQITPFADARLGYSSGDIRGAYGSIGLGVRFGLGRSNKAMSLMISATAQDYDYYDLYYSGIDGDDTLYGVSFKFGFEF